VIFVDANVPMYVIGAEHPHKADAQQVIARVTAARERLVTDAEAFQEILHRYVAINRRDAIQPAFDLLHALVDEIFPVDAAAVDAAKALVLAHAKLSARDAIHAATMRQHGVARIFSFDAGFDGLPGIIRIGGDTQI